MRITRQIVSPNSTVDICSITQLLLHLQCVTENQDIASPCADMPKETTQPSCDGLHLVNRNTWHEVAPSCEGTTGILSVPSCDGTHHHSSASSCDDTHLLLLYQIMRERKLLTAIHGMQLYPLLRIRLVYCLHHLVMACTSFCLYQIVRERTLLTAIHGMQLYPLVRIRLNYCRHHLVMV